VSRSTSARKGRHLHSLSSGDESICRKLARIGEPLLRTLGLAQPVPARQGAPKLQHALDRGSVSAHFTPPKPPPRIMTRLVLPVEGQATYQHRQVSYHRQAAGEVRSVVDIVHCKQLIVSRPKLAQAKLNVRSRHRVQ
jgi:hypothetical protein